MRAPGVRCAAHAESRPGYEGLRAGAVFLCRLHEDARPARLVMTLPADASPAQELAPELDHAPYRDGGEFLRGDDLNGDGWMDLLVMTSGGSIGSLYAVYTYDPDQRRFAQDSVFDIGANVARIPGTPCARSLAGNGANGYNAEDYCWREGRWVHTRQETQDYVPGQPRGVDVYRREVRELRGGQLQLARVDTIRIPEGR